ncbi:dephospho-CoA kinase [Ornithinimicrobium pekingense]|uniref:Dephospho-CoA kinase n=1 Tax=Ornithinimicrobium pekingense TaxID=384677 RepID=A0ABQ2FB16_9MICO|nr:dephospho-CoA kinase [Ornithinimicrobium pekingense]GGK68408.1 dephospho-CoA kinase [Ornithinimicrobium pekingense]
MLRVGLSGGIGSGKSTVSQRLAELGAVVLDADRIAREVVEPGAPALAEIADRFGAHLVTDEGALDRPALAAVVFGDESARRDLEAITHPRIAERTAALVGGAPQDAVVVHDIPLLVELDRVGDYALTVIVDVPEDVRLHRLVELRGMEEEQARARIRAQADDRARRAAADVLLPNSGTLEELRSRVDRLWWDRLVPFEANLRLGRKVRRSEDLTVVDPDPSWPAQGARLVARLRAALGDRAARVDHIGSTAVPGLAAKDVIDLQVVVPTLEVLDEEAVRTRLGAVGFTAPASGWDHARGAGTGEERWPKRLWGGADPARVVHVHGRAADGNAWRLALLMRDWLRDDEQARSDYAELKAVLVASGLPTSDYAEAKEPWFARAFPRAQEWAARTGWAPGP